MTFIYIILGLAALVGFLYVTVPWGVKGFNLFFRHQFKKSDTQPITLSSKVIDSSLGAVDKSVHIVKWSMVVLAALLAVVAVVAWIWVWLS